MKPKYLAFCGINSFSEPAVIDFENLLDQGLFGIFGDTGSGKSTILDSIGFALYGSVTRAANSADFINFRCEKGNVVFVFEIFYDGARRTYRVEREIKRKKDGTPSQSLVVYEETDGKLVTKSSGVREGNAFLLGVIGLKQDDFEKCIALPQGEFARFIKEAPRERLDIVSRLFDLERFGGNLFHRASARSAELMKETEILAARLLQYAEISKEKLGAVAAEIGARSEAETAYRDKIGSKRAEEKKLHALSDRRKEFEKVCAQKAALDAKREEMARMEGELGRLGAAKEIVSAERERRECERLSAETDRRLDFARQRAEEAKCLLAQASAYDETQASAEIESLTAKCGRAELAERAMREKAAAEKELLSARSQYETLKKRSVDPDYENQLKQLLALQQQLGHGDLYAFLAAQKDALYRGEYERFASEIKKLEQKYPVILPDSAPLVARYSKLSEGEKLDFSDLKAAFERRERAMKASEQARLDLESAQNTYLLEQSRLSALAEKISSLQKTVASCKERMGDTSDFREMQVQLAEKKSERDRHLAAKMQAERGMNAAQVALASCEAEGAARKDALHKAEERLSRMLEKFQSVEEAEGLLARYGDAENANRLFSEYRDRAAAVSSKYEELKDDDYSQATEERLLALQREIVSLEEERDGNAGRLAVLKETEKRIVGMLSEKEELETEYRKKQKASETAQQLTSLLRGGKFMEFVAEEYLQTVACNASVQLLSLTGGRYFLRYVAGGFGVGDNFNGGALRAVSTLSGGETFLVSLSLALALSSEICTRSARPIEFFFLDEGFGTLDEKLVDTVMDSLEKLKSKNFSIGIISHVEELKHRIERKLLVAKATEERGSRISAE